MRKSRILAYDGRKPKKRVKYSLIVDIVDISDETYLIADLYNYKKMVYRMAISEKSFSHYDYRAEKWDMKCGYNMLWQGEIRAADITETDYAKLKKFRRHVVKESLSKYRDPVDYIRALECNIQDIKEKAKADRQEKERMELFELIPDIPDTFSRTIQTHIDRDNIIYYKRKGSRVDYKCCQCGQEFTRRFYRPQEVDLQFGLPHMITMPSRFAADTCDMCGCNAILLQRGHAKLTTQEFTTLLYQTAQDKTLIIRGFYTSVDRNIYGQMQISTREYGVMFLRRGMVRSYHRYYEQERWYKNKHMYIESRVPVYEAGYNVVQSSDLKYIPADMYELTNCKDTETSRNINKLIALISYANAPQLETLYKIGFTGICRSLMWAYGSSRQINKKAKDAAGILRINKQQMRWLADYAKAGNDRTGWEMIKFADQHNIQMKHYDIAVKLYRHSQSNLHYCLRFMSIEKLYNLLNKYKDSYGGALIGTLREYADYLRERDAAGDDMTNTVVLRPRDLHETYTRVRIEAQQRRDKDYMDKVCEKYPDIGKRSLRIPKKYTWHYAGLMIRPAESAREIVMEGRILHHCVGSEHQRYLKNYNDGKAWIMLIRRESEPDKPYVTVELKNNVIQQWYGLNDTKPDKKQVDKFLAGYVEHIRKVGAKTA